MIFKILLPAQLERYRNDAAYLNEARESIAHGLSKLSEAVFVFTRLYWQNKWMIQLSNDVYEFFIDDLPFFWDQMPAVLRKVTQHQNIHLYVSLSEDASYNLLLISEAGSEDLKAQLVAGYHSNKSSSPVYLISRTNCVNEWRQFVHSIISLLLQEHLIEENAPSIADFLGQIEA